MINLQPQHLELQVLESSVEIAEILTADASQFRFLIMDSEIIPRVREVFPPSHFSLQALQSLHEVVSSP